MTQHAHTTDLKPRQLPATWTNPDTGKTHMGLKARSPQQLAALGWYPIQREPLQEGAAGYGDAYLDEATQQIVIPSLPGDPGAARERYFDNLSCTQRQGMLELAAAGYIDAVDAYFATAAREDQIWYQYESTWMFRDPRVQGLGTQLALTEDQIIQLFESARQR